MLLNDCLFQLMSATNVVVLLHRHINVTQLLNTIYMLTVQ